MGKSKPRWYPNKKQNQYGNFCSYYEESNNGYGYCESLLTNGNPTVICKGNPHNCCKVKYHDMARKNGKQYNDYWKHQEELERIQDEYWRNNK